MEAKLRPIQKTDNTVIASVIRSILKEHGVDKPGTVYTDPTTDIFMNFLQLKTQDTGL